MGVINFSFESSLPGSPLPNTLYFIKGASNQFSLVQTDPSGTPYNLNAIAKGPIPFLDFSQSTTPSNPASGIDRFYFKADGNAYRLDSSGSEILLNSNNATYTAAVILSPFQVVQTITETTVGIADCSALSTATGVVGVTLGSSIIGGIVEVAIDGSSVTDLSWAWTAGLPVYLSTAGGLTQTLQPIPVIVGYAISATTITVNINGPFIPLLEAASDPVGAKLYINSSDGTLRYYNGSWTSLGPVDGTTVSMISGVLGLTPIASGSILANTTGSMAKPAALPVGTNGQVLTVVGGVPAWAAGGGGGGGNTMVLAQAIVRSGSDGTPYNTTSTVPVVVDATNLEVTFTAPSSGNVQITLEAGCENSGFDRNFWCLFSGGSAVANTASLVSVLNAEYQRTLLTINLSGLTPGNSYTYQWGWYVNAGTQSLGSGPTFGDISMTVYAVNSLITAKTLTVPVTGFTSTIPSSPAASIVAYVMNPTNALATGTLTMPATPLDSQIVSISSTQTITALTLNANAGQSIENAVTTLNAGPSGAVSYIYDLASTTWYPS